MKNRIFSEKDFSELIKFALMFSYTRLGLFSFDVNLETQCIQHVVNFVEEDQKKTANLLKSLRENKGLFENIHIRNPKPDGFPKYWRTSRAPYSCHMRETMAIFGAEPLASFAFYEKSHKTPAEHFYYHVNDSSIDPRSILFLVQEMMVAASDLHEYLLSIDYDNECRKRNKILELNQKILRKFPQFRISADSLDSFILSRLGTPKHILLPYDISTTELIQSITNFNKEEYNND